jgi:L-lactate dehydrogenase complex protein LldG
MSAREAILAALRAGLGRSAVEPATVAAEAHALLANPETIRPDLPIPDSVEAFILRATSAKVAATLDCIATMDGVPAAVRAYLAKHELPLTIALQPETALLSLDWEGFELRETPTPNETTGLGMARWGIAETGSLVFHSGPETAVLGHFLPLHHIAVLHAADILPYLEDYAALAGMPPRNINLITGPSGTTDIEGSYVRGAHGPRFLHVILVGVSSD